MPIQDLTVDILLEIFHINTEPSCHPNQAQQPLITSIRTSQVCRCWREISLESPSLWAKLVVFGYAINSKRTLKILGRSGKAPLWIRGVVEYWRAYRCLFPIINANWERVEVFDIVLMSSIGDEDDEWATLFRPAPALRTFRLHHLSNQQFFQAPSTSLFGNQAPNLRSFQIPNLRFDLLAPWISDVQDLVLMHHFVLSEITGALQNMRSVRRLCLVDIKSSGEVSLKPADNNTVQLPQLVRLEIRNCPVDVWLPILRIHLPATPFSLSLDNSYRPDLIETETEANNVCQEVLKFLPSIISRYPSPTLSVKGGSGLNFERPWTFHFGLNNGQEELFQVIWTDPILSRSFVANFCSKGWLTCIEAAWLQFADFPLGVQLTLPPLVSSLSSLLTLEASEETINFIVKSCEPDVLPKLRTLSLNKLNYYWGRKNDRPITQFLRRRQAAGLSLPLIDLSEISSAHMLVGDLDSLLGLKIRYDSAEVDT